MMTRQAFRGVLPNYLDTLASRYTDREGYWLFGFIIEEIDTFRLDLLSNALSISDASPTAQLACIAVIKFRDQVEKAGLAMSVIRSAELRLEKLDEAVGIVNLTNSSGYMLDFSVSVKTDLGQLFESHKQEFVAPHNAKAENRRHKQDWFKWHEVGRWKRRSDEKNGTGSFIDDRQHVR